MASSSITSWQTDEGKMETEILSSWAPKSLQRVTAAMKLIAHKAMTNLDRVLKSRDITLPTKVRLVKAVVFPVVVYRCASWTIKKAKCQRIDSFQLEKALQSSVDSKVIKQVNPKGNHP